MPSIYIEKSEFCLRKPRCLRLALRIENVNAKRVKRDIEKAQTKSGQIYFRKLSEVLGSLPGAYTGPSKEEKTAKVISNVVSKVIGSS